MTTENAGRVHCEKRGSVAWIGFDRPQSRNAMTWEMYDALETLCREVDSDPAISAVVFHGCGGEAFVAGTDIKQFAGFESAEDAVDYERRIDRILRGLETLSKPTIALLEGFCVGGGAAIALACDFRYATPSLKFGVPIAKTLGNCLSVTNVSRLMDIVGIPRTKEVLMAARLIEAPQALDTGLVNAVYAPEAIEAAVAKHADEFSQRAPLTVQAAKQLIQRVQEHRRMPADASDDWVRTCYTSDDFKAAVNKFVNKTPFEWTGR